MRRLCIAALLALLLPLLSGCTDGMELEEHVFALAMAVDRTAAGQIRLSVQLLSGGGATDEGGGQSGGSGGESDGEGAKLSQNGYLIVSATGEDYPHALSLMTASVPRKLSLSHLRVVVISEEIARTDAFYPLLMQLQASCEAEESAYLVISQGDARELVASQRPYIGSRLSRYLETMFAYYDGLGYIPGSRLGDVMRALTVRVGDPAVIYAAVQQEDAPQAEAKANPLDALAGELPRESVGRVEYMGAAVFSGQRMTGLLTGAQVQLLRMLTGAFDQCPYFLGGEEYTLRQAGRSRLSLSQDGSRAVLSAQVYLEAEKTLPADADEQALRAQLESELLAVLQRAQQLGSDCAGFGRLAVRRYATIEAWEATDWKSAYASAGLQVSVNLRLVEKG